MTLINIGGVDITELEHVWSSQPCQSILSNVKDEFFAFRTSATKFKYKSLFSLLSFRSGCSISENAVLIHISGDIVLPSFSALKISFKLLMNASMTI